jgi:uncharacterized protein YndB with AHSA1/START domain
MTNETTFPTETHREVRRRRIAAGDARTALIRRHYDAPVADVWDACTSPERLRRWLSPVSGDLRVGGTFQMEGNAHGEILRCEPPRLLAVTWVYGDRPADEVALRLRPDDDGGGTVLELEHASVVEHAPMTIDGRPVDAILGVGIGWEMPLTYSLDLYLRGKLAPAPTGEAPAELEAVAGRLAQAWASLIEASAGSD